MKKKINVKSHTRKHPTQNRKVNVNRYEKEIVVKPFRNNRHSKVHSAKGLTKDSIGYIEWKIMELIKSNDHYGKPTMMYDLFDELAFSNEDEDVITEKVQNLMHQGVIKITRNKAFTPTNEGNRIFWEWYEEYEDDDHLEHLKDNPQKIKDFKKDLKKEGFELIGTSTHPNETILYLKDLEKEAKKIDKQLKENIKFQKSKKK